MIDATVQSAAHSGDAPECIIANIANALGLDSDADLVTELGIHRSTLWLWRRLGIPPRRRFELARRLRERGRAEGGVAELRACTLVLQLLDPDALASLRGCDAGGELDQVAAAADPQSKA